MTITVGDVIATLSPPNLDSRTSDILIAGRPETTVRAIAVSFTASVDVVRQAVEYGANLLITHEGIYYNHHHDPHRYEEYPVIQAKRDMIERASLAVYRNHDHWHRIEPDGIMLGLIRE